jgi:hypothetical protein
MAASPAPSYIPPAPSEAAPPEPREPAAPREYHAEAREPAHEATHFEPTPKGDGERSNKPYVVWSSAPPDGGGGSGGGGRGSEE